MGGGGVEGRWKMRIFYLAALGALLLCVSFLSRGRVVAVAERAASSVVLVWYQDDAGTASYGTAFAVDDKGHFLTCAHVVRGRQEVAIAFPTVEGEANVAARVVASDERIDAALLKADEKGLPAARFGSTKGLRVGEEVIFAGYPMGYTLNADLEPSVGFGHVSALPKWRVSARAPRIPIVQIDASVALGHSGSPLFRTSSGKVIGMLKSHVGVPGLVKSNDEVLDFVESIPSELVGRAGIGIALPADSLRRFLERHGVKT
ncbi:MAG: trypsin-like peptidase domain-containing protein [Candidatus Eisenbacteria bacterium]|nr:trypsin-like peptidase domain-containing protein [Candidatus Eisenbacteria bacterium]